MSTQNRRPSFSSSTTSSLAKRHAPSSENVGKAIAAPPHLAKKRAPLSNLTNQKNASHGALRKSLASSTLVPCTTKLTQTKKKFPACTTNSAISRNKMPTTSNAKSTAVVFPEATSFPQRDESASATAAIPCSMDTSPIKSDGMSVSLDETMSTCDSFKSQEIEYIDNSDVSALNSVDRKTFSNLNISDNSEAPVNVCSRDKLVDLERDGKFVNIDSNYLDPQLCAPYACDIYKHLRSSEAKKRPSTDFMERIQKDINSNMRAILVDWLVEVGEEYRLLPDTLYLTVNYIDRYLSGNVMSRQKLQLLGVACMMIAAKYEEICAPQVEEYCYITDNTYFKEEVLQMESAVLNYLKFEVTAPTIKCFLRQFVRAAQGANEVASLQLEFLTSYIAELSLLEYAMLCYSPSLIAASAIFLAKLILFPSKIPWNSTLQHYTFYKASDLRNCVKDLHRLCYNSHSSSLPAIREKYSQHKYKHVAKKSCPPSIPQELFQS